MNPTGSRKEQERSTSEQSPSEQSASGKEQERSASEQLSLEQSASTGSSRAQVPSQSQVSSSKTRHKSKTLNKGQNQKCSSPATRSPPQGQRNDRQLVPVLPIIYSLTPPSSGPLPRHFQPSTQTQAYRPLRVRSQPVSESSEIFINGGLITSSTRNQEVYLGSCYTGTVTHSSVFVLGGGDHFFYQASMDRANYFYSGPSSQGYDTANGYLSRQQNAGAGSLGHHGHFQQQSAPVPYNGQMMRSDGGIHVTQNHAVNNNFYFTSSGSYDVNLQATANSNGNGMTGFGAAAQPPYAAHSQFQMQPQQAYPGANAFRTFNTAGSAFVPTGTGYGSPGTSMEANTSYGKPTSGHIGFGSNAGTGFGSNAGTGFGSSMNDQRYQHQRRCSSQPQFGQQFAGPEAGYPPSHLSSPSTLSQSSVDTDVYDDQENNGAHGSFSKPGPMMASSFQNRFQ